MPTNPASLEFLESVASTMDAARDGLRAGRAVFSEWEGCRLYGLAAREQTAGRGQRGRAWFDRPGESLSVTYALALKQPEADDEKDKLGTLALAAGVAVVETLDALRRVQAAPETLAGIGLKWPNDILLNGKKAGGILIETLALPTGESFALIGVGVNLMVRAFPPDLASAATSLALAGFDPPPAPEALAALLFDELARTVISLRQNGFAVTLDLWRRYDRTPGCRFETFLEGATVTGTALGVDARGALRLRLEGGREIAVLAASSLRAV